MFAVIPVQLVILLTKVLKVLAISKFYQEYELDSAKITQLYILTVIKMSELRLERHEKLTKIIDLSDVSSRKRKECLRMKPLKKLL